MSETPVTPEHSAIDANQAKGAAKVRLTPRASARAKSVGKKPAPAVKTAETNRQLHSPNDGPAPAARSAKEQLMEKATETMTEKAKSAFTEASERAKAQMEKGTRAFEDVAAFNKGNIEAIVESSKIAAKGFEKMGQGAAEYAKASYEHATGTLKSMSSVKSPTELFKLQSDFARSSFDAFVAEASRSTEAVLKLAGEIAQPISNRVTIAAEKIKVSA